MTNFLPPQTQHTGALLIVFFPFLFSEKRSATNFFSSLYFFHIFSSPPDPTHWYPPLCWVNVKKTDIFPSLFQKKKKVHLIFFSLHIFFIEFSPPQTQHTGALHHRALLLCQRPPAPLCPWRHRCPCPRGAGVLIWCSICVLMWCYTSLCCIAQHILFLNILIILRNNI